MSELLHRLRRELDALSDPIEKAEVLARIAGVLARSGSFDEARIAINLIKDHFGRGESGRVTVWKMVAEGLVFHYENLSPAALERINGALVLGRAMKYSAVIALASAWKAHIEFERSEFSRMAESLALALASVGPAEHDAQTRISMVFANAFMICGDRSQMQIWFMRGRDHALKDGDRASVEALQYNKAAFATAWARLSNCTNPIKSEELQALRIEVNSARNLQELARIDALSGHIKLIHARLLIMEEKYQGAIDALKEVRVTEPFARHNFHQAYIDLELQYCGFKLGNSEISLALSYLDYLHEFSGLDVDEKIIAVWMLVQLAEAEDLPEAVTSLRVELSELLARHAADREALHRSLVSLV